MGFGSIFKKIGRSVGNVFKKGVRAVGNIAKKGVYEGARALPALGGLGGSAIGSELGQGLALSLEQPELAPAFGVIGGAIGGQIGKELGREGKSRIERPLPRGRARLGTDPRTYTPIKNQNEIIGMHALPPQKRIMPKDIVARNELEKRKVMREPPVKFN